MGQAKIRKMSGSKRQRFLDLMKLITKFSKKEMQVAADLRGL